MTQGSSPILRDYGYDRWSVKYRSGKRFKQRGRLLLVRIVPDGPASPIIDEIDHRTVLVLDPRAVVRGQDGHKAYDGTFVTEERMMGRP